MLLSALILMMTSSLSHACTCAGTESAPRFVPTSDAAWAIFEILETPDVLGLVHPITGRHPRQVKLSWVKGEPGEMCESWRPSDFMMVLRLDYKTDNGQVSAVAPDICSKWWVIGSARWGDSDGWSVLHAAGGTWDAAPPMLQAEALEKEQALRGHSDVVLMTSLSLGPLHLFEWWQSDTDEFTWSSWRVDGTNHLLVHRSKERVAGITHVYPARRAILEAGDAL